MHICIYMSNHLITVYTVTNCGDYIVEYLWSQQLDMYCCNSALTYTLEQLLGLDDITHPLTTLPSTVHVIVCCAM